MPTASPAATGPPTTYQPTPDGSARERAAGERLIDRFWLRAAAIGALAIGGVILSSDEGPILCPYRRCTGGYCPGCGLTRSGGHLLRGDLQASLSAHPYLVVLVAQAVGLAVLWTAGSARVRRALRSRATLVAVVNTVLLLTIWLIRLASGAIPAPFAG